MRKHTPRPCGQTLRDRVELVVNASPTPLTGLQVSHASRLAYKQAIDALNALHNHGRITRVGSKFTARWSRLQPTHHTTNPAAEALNQAFRSFTLGRR